MVKKLSRREFIEKSAIGVTGITVTLSAKSYGQIIGSNDRIQIGFLGCGSRSRGHRRMVKMVEQERNLGVAAVCDIWTLNRERAAEDCKKVFNTDVKQFKYSEDMLQMNNLDAVMIATGDFQHGKILAEVVKAGKDCYCEKPMAEDVSEAKLARDAVLGSKQVVQMGSQWVSDPVQSENS